MFARPATHATPAGLVTAAASRRRTSKPRSGSGPPSCCPSRPCCGRASRRAAVIPPLPTAPVSASEREGARIARQLKALRREVERLIDAYQAAAITLAELQERRRQIEDHGRHLQDRLDEIRCQRSGREQELRLLQGLEAFCEGIRDALIDPPFETKQKVLRLVIDQVVVEEDRLVIRHVVPTTPVGLQPHSRSARQLRRRQG